MKLLDDSEQSRRERLESECGFVWSVRETKVLEEGDWVAENNAFLDFFFIFGIERLKTPVSNLDLKCEGKYIQIIIDDLSKIIMSTDLTLFN